ncbi:MAG: hypothetical protein ACRDYC_05630 [Acidimicrobiales bacterium]
MGATLPPADQSLVTTLGNMIQNGAAQAAQQQNVITDANGNPVIYIGLIPSSDPPIYGMQFVDPTSGTPIMFIGLDASGHIGFTLYDSSGKKRIMLDSDGLTQFDASGNKLFSLGTQASGLDGLAMFDSLGTEQVLIGALSTAFPLYGLAVRPEGGTHLQQVGGFLQGAQVQALDEIGGPGNFTPTGEVVAIIGDSGEVQIALTGTIATGEAVQEGNLGVSIDGAAVLAAAPNLVVNSGGGGILVAASISYVQGGLTPGSHTFQPVWTTFNDSGSYTVSFTDVQVTIQPL